MKTQIVAGPPSEVARCLSSRRFFIFMHDPIVHYYRVSWQNSTRTTQARTLCGRPVAWGTHEVRAEAPTCPVCNWKLNYQSRDPVIRKGRKKQLIYYPATGQVVER